tara:strand:+ start:3429 stop:3935 length:507 start_codon:yes stop_codon:yes gene_type:complete
MPNATERRRILVNAIVSTEDKNNKSSDLGFKHTLNKNFKPYKMHLTSSLSLRNEDVMSLGHVQQFLQERFVTLTERIIRADASEQVYDLDVPTGYKVATGSASLKINGLEQQSSDDQKTSSNSDIDYYLSGSRYEQLVLYKSRQDHSGLTVDNQDSLIINYKMEKYVG